MTLSRLLTLRADLRDPDAAAEVAPEALAAYAERTGWRLATTTDVFAVYHHDGHPDAELQVPIEAGWRDYGRRVLSELRELARVEDRSPLAIWAELVGVTDTAAETVQALDAMLAGLVTMPSMYARCSEALLMQALLAANIRARLRSEPDVDDRYDAARLRRGIPSSTHACDRLNIAGTASFVAEVLGLPAPEPSDGTTLSLRSACFTGDMVESVSAQRSEGAQGVLLGIPAPARGRRRSVHRWGVIAREELPPDPLASGPHEEQVERCRHCLALRRRANTGARLGAQLTYSRDGREWSYTNPACVMKD